MRILLTLKTTEVREEIWVTEIAADNLQRFHDIVCKSTDILWEDKLCKEAEQTDSYVIPEESFSSVLKYKVIVKEE
jgi:hypothetical protein